MISTLTKQSNNPSAAGIVGIISVSQGGTGTGTAGIAAFNNITGLTASGTTGTTSTNLVFSTSPSLTTPSIGVATGTSLSCSSGFTMMRASSSASGALTVSDVNSFAGVKIGLVATLTNSSAVSTSGAIGLSMVVTRSATTGGNTQTLISGKFSADYSSTGTQTDAMGIYAIATKSTSPSGSITNAYSGYFDTPTATGGGTIGTGYTLYTNGTGPIGLGGPISIYNGIATVSNGVPSELATVDLTAQSAAKTATTLYTPTATGMFRVSVYLQVTTAASTSSVLGGTTGVVITYNDGDGNVAQSDTVALMTTGGAIAITSAGNTTATNLNGTMVIYARTGVAIQYAVDYTSVGVTPMAFSIHIKLEAL